MLPWELRSKEAVVLAAEQQDYMTSEHVILLRMDAQARDFRDLQLRTRKTQIVTTENFQISIRRGI